MAYATVSHVNARCPLRVFGASTIPTADQVVTYLEDTAGELDGLLQAAGYQLPIPAAATSALQLLRSANTAGAWALVEEGAPASTDADRARKEWARLQAQLDPNGKGTTLELPDVPRQANETQARAGYISRDPAALGPIITLDPCDW